MFDAGHINRVVGTPIREFEIKSDGVHVEAILEAFFDELQHWSWDIKDSSTISLGTLWEHHYWTILDKLRLSYFFE